jgi:hypothetical protein
MEILLVCFAFISAFADALMPPRKLHAISSLTANEQLASDELMKRTVLPDNQHVEHY